MAKVCDLTIIVHWILLELETIKLLDFFMMISLYLIKLIYKNKYYYYYYYYYYFDKLK